MDEDGAIAPVFCAGKAGKAPAQVKVIAAP
jgi:hypothetical protein